MLHVFNYRIHYTAIISKKISTISYQNTASSGQSYHVMPLHEHLYICVHHLRGAGHRLKLIRPPGLCQCCRCTRPGLMRVSPLAHPQFKHPVCTDNSLKLICEGRCDVPTLQYFVTLFDVVILLAVAFANKGLEFGHVFFCGVSACLGLST